MQQRRMKRGVSGCVKVILCGDKGCGNTVLFLTDGKAKNTSLELKVNFDLIKTDTKTFKCSLKIQTPQMGEWMIS